MGKAVLHPIQFEELNARFIYSNYILKEIQDGMSAILDMRW